MPDKFIPSYDFDQYFGKNPEDYFNAARIAKAEQAYAEYIEEKKDSSLEKMAEMVQKMTAQIAEIEPGQTMDGVIDSVYAQAFSIKCSAGMYGYPLATAFANQLFYYCKEVAGKPLTAGIQSCMQAHLEALRIIFKKDIRSMSDPVALELLKELDRIGDIT